MRVLVLLALVAVALADRIHYDGYKVYNAIPKTKDDAALLNLLAHDETYDFWSDGILLGANSTIMVPPQAQELFESTLTDNKVTYSVLISDVERVVEMEFQRKLHTPKLQKGRISFTEYHRYDDMVAYLERIAADHPMRASLEVFGYSTEERPLYAIHIGTGPSDNPTLLFECGIHAREWIAPAVCLYVVYQLLESDNDRDLISNVNWIIIPSLNPDGYEYTHTTSRFWRKTRSPGLSCYGADANRNFDYFWMEAGASANECSETFAGRYAFSEPEAVAFAALVERIENLAVHLSVHSYGEWLLYPWAHVAQGPDNAEEHQIVGDKFAETVASVEGTVYTVGNLAALLYRAAGNSIDWVYQAGARLSYCIELSGGGTNGFDLPPDRILSVSQEVWIGFLTFYDYAVEIGRSS